MFPHCPSRHTRCMTLQALQRLHLCNIPRHLVCRVVEHRLFLRIQRQLDNPRKPLLCQYAGHTHGDIRSPILALKNRHRRQNTVPPIGDRIDHLRNGHAGCIAGDPRLLQPQNLTAALSGALDYLFDLLA